MTSTTTDASPLVYQEMHEQGLQFKDEKNVVHRGRLYKAENWEKDGAYSTGEKVAATLVGGIATVGTVCVAPFLDIFHEKITSKVLGKDEDTAYFEVDETVRNAKDPQKNPLYDKRFDIRDIDAVDAREEATFLYDPNKPATVVQYINRPGVRRELRQGKGGHLYLIEKRRPGVSSFIFVPKGEYSKAVSVLLWNAETGGKLTNEDQIEQAVQSYCASFEAIEKGWSEEAEKLAPRLIKLQNKDKSEEELEQLVKDPTKVEAWKKTIMSRRRTTVLDLANHRARIYAKVDPNVTKTDDYETGVTISFDEELTKDINKIHGLTGKEDLKGERPFREPLPKEDGDFSSDSEEDIDLGATGRPKKTYGRRTVDPRTFERMFGSRRGDSEQNPGGPLVEEVSD